MTTSSNEISVTCDYRGASFDVPFISENITLTKSVIRPRTIRSDRMVEASYITEYEVSGDVSFYFKPDIFDTFIETSVCALATDSGYKKSWTVGSTIFPYTIQKNNISTGDTLTLTDCVTDSLSLTFPYNDIVTGSCQFLASGFETTRTTNTRPVTDKGLFLTSKMGVLEIDGTSSGVCVTEMDINIVNNVVSRGELGENINRHLFIDEFNVVGTVSAYLTPETYSIYLASLEQGKTFSLRFWAASEDNIVYEFYIPNVDLEINTPIASGVDQDIIVEIGYFGLYSPQLNTALLINKYQGVSLVDIALNRLWPKL